ncbi:MAG TPA: 16S rRNA (guanine(527)-N(7))-methyltransferase RsmG [Methylomirabilota bacterium]|nr:16S rRNA (guanine(527)-N(7))-methyltransferase RsmG [Methylomirabilota bacterium]
MTSRSAGPLEELRVGIEALTSRPAKPEELARFERYLDLFIRWNRIHRMTALDSPGAIARDLFLDSLLYLRFLPHVGVRIVDIGAGAGIPGLPLKVIAPDIELTLIEAKRKRVSFLLAARRELGLYDVEIEEGRAESLVASKAELAGSFDVAVSRAVGAAGTLLVVARKYLKPGGLFVTTGPPRASVRPPLVASQVAVPGSRRMRTFLTALKES